MDPDYKRITNKLNNYKKSHPNFYNLWSQYLLLKRQNMKTDLINCESMLERLDTQSDITYENLVTLLILNNSNHLNTIT